jgi:hypothetical protein
MTALSRDQLRELSPDATRAVREMIQRKRQGRDGQARDRHSFSASLAVFAAIRRASSRVHLIACHMVRNNRKGRAPVAGFNRPIVYPKLVY